MQDIHSVLEITIYDEDSNRTTEFIGKVAIPLLAVRNFVFKIDFLLCIGLLF